MGTKIYVSNLSYDAGDADLYQVLADHGFTPSDAKVIRSGEDGRSRGFGFATLASADELSRAVAELDGYEFMGRAMRVAEAHDKRPRNGGARGRNSRRDARGQGHGGDRARSQGRPQSFGWEDV